MAYEVLCCKLGLRLGREVIWRHDATQPLATDTLANPHVRDNGRAPVQNSERFAMIRLGGQILASYGAMSTTCCTHSTTGRRVLVPQRSCGTSWPLRAGPPVDQRLKLLSYLHVQLHDTHVALARGDPWLGSRGHGIPP